MDTEIFEKIKKFTVTQTGVREGKITEDAELENDLGISGDDAVEYLIAFSKEFNVDISKFMAADYISPEGDSILPAIIRVFTGKKHPKQKELKIHHLEKAIIAGRLDEEIVNS
jgi:acyl carrier protein